jgi:ribonuclease J
VGHARARNALAYAGLIAVTIALDEKSRVAGEPSLLLEGVPDAVHEGIRQALDEAVRRYNPKRDNEEAFKENVRRAVRRAASNAWGKKPVTRVDAIWV